MLIFEYLVNMKLLTTSQVAKLLGISRIAVFKQIKSGAIPATKVGRNYLIKRADVYLPTDALNEKNKKAINASIDKVIDEYSETLKLLKDA